MALFSRRTLQRLLNENSKFLSQTQTENHVKKLNEGKLEYEWEIASLNAFSRLGKVTHEPSFPDSQKGLDIFFQSKDGDVEFLADVTTISDDFLEKENPVEYLTQELGKIKLKNKLPGSFSFSDGGHSEQNRRSLHEKPLFLPTMSDFDSEILNNSEFRGFIAQIVKAPSHNRAFRITSALTDLKILYSVGGFSFSTYPSYKEILTLQNNTIWNALFDKYKNQLKKSGYKGPQGIILCDGDNYGLGNRYPTHYAKSSREVIEHFLRKKPNVAFVMVLTTPSAGSGHNYNIGCKTYIGNGFEGQLGKFFKAFERKVPNLFPKPINDSTNARIRLKETSRHFGSSFYGGITVSPDEIKVSARTILRLLAGQIPLEDFPSEYKKNFERHLQMGNLITKASIESVKDEDDDWFVFGFGQADAAISPFRTQKD